MNEQKRVVETVPRYLEGLRNSVQQFQEVVDLQGKDTRQNNSAEVILHNIPESSSQDAMVWKQHDSEVFQKIVEALLAKMQRSKSTQVFRLRKKQSSGEEGTASNRKPRLMMLKL